MESKYSHHQGSGQRPRTPREHTGKHSRQLRYQNPSVSFLVVANTGDLYPMTRIIRIPRRSFTFSNPMGPHVFEIP